MKTNATHFLILTAMAFALLWARPDARAGTGTVQTSTLTFADSSTGDLQFTVRTDIDAGADGTSLQLEFAPDGNNAALAVEPFPTPASVSFSLSYSGTPISGFSCTAQQAVTGCAASPSSPNVSVLLNKQPASFGRYTLTISYPAGSHGLSDAWVLGVTGIPTSPSIRTDASIVNGTFEAPLTPHGPCGAGGSGGSGGGGTGGFKNICVLDPPICEIAWEPIWYPWPPVGPPCLSCPIQWQGTFGEEFQRVIVNFTAYTKGSVPLGAGQAKQIQLQIEGGRAIGDLVDLGGSQYATMVESRKGEPSPRITPTIAGVTAPTFVAGSTVAAANSPLTAVLSVLLVLSLILAGYLAKRARAAANSAR